MEGILGYLNNGITLDFGIHVDDDTNYEISKRQNLIKGSSSIEKGGLLSFTDDKNSKAKIEFKDLMSHIIVDCDVLPTNSLVKLSCKIPNSEIMQVSEFYVQGYFQLDKVTVNKRSIKGEEVQKKLIDAKKLLLDKKVLVEIKGPPLIKQEFIQTAHGMVARVRPKLEVEI